LQAFEYSVARSVDEATMLLSEKGDQARPLAGGTDLIVQLRIGRRKPHRLVDIKDVPEANRLAYNTRDGLHLGASVPCHVIYENAAIRQAYPCLIDAVELIGGIGIQGRASVGGNLCNAAPSADAIPPLIVLQAMAIVVGPNGTREVPVEQFCTAPGQTVLKLGEFLVSLRIPPPERNSGAYYLRFIPRNEMDIAVVGAGVSVVLDDKKQRFLSARIALASVAPTPLFVEAAGQCLVGLPISEDALQSAANAAMAAARPISDMRGTTEYRRHLVGVLTKRALRGALERAREG